MSRAIVIVAAAGLILAAAVAEGLRSNRWSVGDDVQMAAERLARIPAEVRDWVGADWPLDPKVVRAAEATGSVSRTYTRRRDGETVSVLLLCGPPGPIGAHTPDVCYGGWGYRGAGRPTIRYLLAADGPDSFWTARFEKPDGSDVPLRVYWAWGVEGRWHASDSPRTQFAWRPVLDKLYVARRLTGAATAAAPTAGEPDEVIEAFLRDFLPVVRVILAS